jgi:hypothetical protein
VPYPGAPHSFFDVRATEYADANQIAPTILKVLGLKPQALQAVRLEPTHVLAGLKLGHD